MVAVCKTWSIPGDKRITGLCSMEMFRETERIMKDGCPICVRVNPIPGPTLCFGCGVSDNFPAIWNISPSFSISGSPAIPFTYTSVFSDNGSTQRTEDGADATITYTSYYYDPTAITAQSLVCARNAGVAACSWGYSAMECKGWMQRPTMGSPLSPSPPAPQCSFVPGYLEERFTYEDFPATYLPGGNVTLGDPFRALLSSWVWSGMDELVLYPLNGIALVDTPAVFPYDAIDSCTNAGYYVPGAPTKYWSFLLKPIPPTGTIILTLKTYHYAFVTSDKVILESALTPLRWRNSAIIGDQPLGGVSPTALNGEASWVGTYPCGNPDTITLTFSAKGGLLSTYTLPSTVVIERAA